MRNGSAASCCVTRTESFQMIDVIIIDHEERPCDASAWVNPIQASTDNVRSLTVINAVTGSTETYHVDA